MNHGRAAMLAFLLAHAESRPSAVKSGLVIEEGFKLFALGDA